MYLSYVEIQLVFNYTVLYSNLIIIKYVKIMSSKDEMLGK